MSNSQRLATSRATSSLDLAAGLKNLSGTRPASGAPKKSGAAIPLTDAPRAGGAETQVYQVPRELIEIARANSRSRAHVGTLTPIAPRPDNESGVNVKAYAALISESPAAPSGMQLDSAPSIAIEPGADSEPFVASEPSDASEPRVISARVGALDADLVPLADEPEADGLDARMSHSPAQPSSAGFPLRACLYVGVLVALGYCAQLVTWPW